MINFFAATSKLFPVASPVCESFIIGFRPIPPANFFRQSNPSQMQVLPDICVEMCRLSSTPLVVYFPASLGSPSSFCDWKKLCKFSAHSAAFFPLFPSGRWLTFSRPPDVQPCLPPTIHSIKPAMAPCLQFNSGVRC